MKQQLKKTSCSVFYTEELVVRPLKLEEYPLLEDFLYDAIYLPEGTAPLPKEIIRQPELAIYMEDFGRPGDFCLAAEADGQVVGAVWTRILAGETKGYGNIDEHTPEFAISVKKEFRRRGIGRKLMWEMLVLLKEQGYKRTSLSVNKENYAFSMYRKLGFRVVEEQEEDYRMLLDLSDFEIQGEHGNQFYCE